MTSMARLYVAIAAGVFAGCGNDNGGDPIDGGSSPDALVNPLLDAGPPGACGADPNCPNPTFSCLHAQVFRDPNRCSVCHDPSVRLGDFSISADKNAAFTAVTGNSNAIGAPKPKRVVATMPTESWLYIKLLPNPPVGTQMPQTGPLRQCEIDAVRTWITNGAMND